MKIDKNIPIKSTPNTPYNSDFWLKISSKIEVGDSILLKVNEYEASKTRVVLDQTLKKNAIIQKYSFKKWDDKNYRVWRTA